MPVSRNNEVAASSWPVKQSYLPHIDGLRAIAILAVLVYHARPTWLSGGYIGVDVFFVISGFLITSLILKELADGHFSLLSFYVRRMRRLMPAGITTMLASAVLAYFILLPDAFSEFGRSLYSSALFVSNFYFYKHTGYFDGPAHDKPLLHTWSLSVEEQFYFIWPLLLLVLVPRVSRAALLVAVAALCLMSLVFAEYKLQLSQNYSFYMLATRLWELGLGALLALTIQRFTPSRIYAEILCLTGLGAIVFSAVYLTSSTSFPGLAAVPACLGAAFVIAAGARGNPYGVRILSLRPAVFIGLISYSLYLWHWPLLALGRYHVQRVLTPGEALALIALAVILAILSWRYVERPFRARSAVLSNRDEAGAAIVRSPKSPQQTTAANERHRPSHRREFAYGFLATAMVSLLGATMVWGKGWPWRLDPVLRMIFHEMSEGNELRQLCDGNEKAFVNDMGCSFGKKKNGNGSYRIAVFGDSNADHFVPLFNSLTERKMLTGRQITQSTCAPILGYYNQDWAPKQKRICPAYHNVITKFVEANPNLKLVVLAANWQSYPFALPVSSSPKVLALPARVRRKADDLGFKPNDIRYHIASTVFYFRDRGINVLLIGQVPYFHKRGGLPIRCIVDAIKKGKSTDICGVSERLAREPLRASDEYFQFLSQEIEGVTAFVPTRILCKSGSCVAMADGKFLYRDAGHLSRTGAHYLGQFLPVLEVLH